MAQSVKYFNLGPFFISNRGIHNLIIEHQLILVEFDKFSFAKQISQLKIVLNQWALRAIS